MDDESYSDWSNKIDASYKILKKYKNTDQVEEVEKPSYEFA